MPDGLLAELERRYGLGGGEAVEPLRGGYANDVFATAAWYFARDGAALDEAALARFVAAYRDAGGRVPAAEDDLLVPFIRVKRVLEVLRAPTDRHVDWDEQRTNLVAAERLR